MEKTILAISGRQGLFQLISRGNGMLIVESIDETKRRTPAGGRERVTSLNDVAIYTNGEDEPLMEVFDCIKREENGMAVPFDPKKVDKDELVRYMSKILPEYDVDRVNISDMRKLFSWYNILVHNGLTDFLTESSDKTEERKE